MIKNSVKLGTITSIFLRAYRLSDPEFIDQEIAFITKVFSKLPLRPIIASVNSVTYS